MTLTRFLLPLAALLLLSAPARTELPVNVWRHVERGDIPG
jgi:hypothetical protein